MPVGKEMSNKRKSMKRARKLYESILAASLAHAKWDYETSLNIIKNRKKLLMLLILLSPILLVSVAVAREPPPFAVEEVHIVTLALTLEGRLSAEVETHRSRRSIP